MADSDTSLFVFLIIFWSLLTIFTSVFSDYLDEDLSSDIRDFKPDGTIVNDIEQTGFQKFMSNLYNTLEDIPIINLFVPLVKLLTFEYTTKIPGAITVLLQATLIFTYYVIYNTLFKK